MPTPIQNMATIMRANLARKREMFADDEDEDGAVWRTFPAEGTDSKGKKVGGSPHKIRQSDGMILDRKPDGSPGVLYGKTTAQLKVKKAFHAESLKREEKLTQAQRIDKKAGGGKHSKAAQRAMGELMTDEEKGFDPNVDDTPDFARPKALPEAIAPPPKEEEMVAPTLEQAKEYPVGDVRVTTYTNDWPLSVDEKKGTKLTTRSVGDKKAVVLMQTQWGKTRYSFDGGKTWGSTTEDALKQVNPEDLAFKNSISKSGAGNKEPEPIPEPVKPIEALSQRMKANLSDGLQAAVKLGSPYHPASAGPLPKLPGAFEMDPDTFHHKINQAAGRNVSKSEAEYEQAGIVGDAIMDGEIVPDHIRAHFGHPRADDEGAGRQVPMPTDEQVAEANKNQAEIDKAKMPPSASPEVIEPKGENPAPPPKDAIPNPVTGEPEPPAAKGTPAAASQEEAKKTEPMPDTPREVAADTTKRMMDTDYAFARPSAVGNVGADLANSARHKRNAWRGLADAEENGTAAALVTRENLLKNEPHNLVVSAENDPHVALGMHYALKAFPPAPGYGSKRKGDDATQKKDRQQFLDTYREYKAEAERLANTEKNPFEALRKLQTWTGNKIKSLRGATSNDIIGQNTAPDRYNNTANALIGTTNALLGRNKTSVIGKLNDFAKASVEKYGVDLSNTAKIAMMTGAEKDVIRGKLAQITRHAQDIIEGTPIGESFGVESSGKKRTQINPADLYIGKPERKGGRDISAITSNPNAATRHLVDNFGMSGVQWGQSMTDDERAHHARHTVEALTDLADVLGFRPQDLSMGGKLGLAMGARGKGSASAHYEPGDPDAKPTPLPRAINLTRAKGVGTLAHEWGHAFDHDLAGGGLSSDDKGRRSAMMLSDDVHPESMVQAKEGDKRHPHYPRYKVDDQGKVVKEDKRKDPIWAAMHNVRKSWDESGYKKRLRDAVREAYKTGLLWKNPDYWHSGREMFARAFERYVQHKLAEKGQSNTYLSGMVKHGSDPKDEMGVIAGLWPSDEETARMAPAFDALMAAHRKKKYGSEDPVQFSSEDVLQMAAEMEFDLPIVRMKSLMRRNLQLA